MEDNKGNGGLPVVRQRAGGLGMAVALASLLAGSVAAIAVLAWATWSVLADSARESGFDVWVGRVAACGAWLALLWLVVGFSIAVVAALHRSAGGIWDRLAMRVAPAGVRRVAHLAAGTVLMSGTVAATTVPAVADSFSLPTPAVSQLPDLDRPFLPAPPAPTGGGSAVGGRASSERPDPSTSASAAAGASTATEFPSEQGARPPRLAGADPASSEDHSMPHTVTVGVGDTLWDIARARLGPDATTADIATEWPRWFVANRRVIGDDPDLIYPGERLIPP